jgi:carbamoyl-phosphate synthase large subunit
MRILMSAAGSAAATSIIRHLRALGHYVIGMDADALAAPLAQEECDEFFLAPLALSTAYPVFLQGLSSRIDLFIPFIDEELRVLASGAVDETLLNKTLLCPADTIRLCTSKIAFQQFCEEQHLPIAPRTNTLPAIYKPDQGRGGRGVMRLDDPDQLNYARKQHGVIQSLLDGTEYTVDVLTDKQGGWIFGLPRKRLQTAGVSRIGEIDIHPAVMALAQECVRKIPFRYGINIQIMLDKHDHPHLIEINPRFAGSLMFSVAAGFDILKMTLDTFAENPITIPDYADIKKLRSIRYWQEKEYEQPL